MAQYLVATVAPDQAGLRVIRSRAGRLVVSPSGVILNQPWPIQWLPGRNGVFPAPLDAQTENAAFLISVQRCRDASDTDGFSELLRKRPLYSLVQGFYRT